MQDNIQFYIKNNATGIFCQGNREKGGEFAELRGYLLKVSCYGIRIVIFWFR